MGANQMTIVARWESEPTDHIKNEAISRIKDFAASHFECLPEEIAVREKAGSFIFEFVFIPVAVGVMSALIANKIQKNIDSNSDAEDSTSREPEPTQIKLYDDKIPEDLPSLPWKEQQAIAALVKLSGVIKPDSDERFTLTMIFQMHENGVQPAVEVDRQQGGGCSVTIYDQSSRQL